ncbi:MAG: GeoRSP system radical SAM/SPASM protein [Myxococcota bacterium]
MALLLEHLLFELTNVCNARCPHCYIVGVSEDCFLDAASVKRSLKDAAAIGARRISLTGGEPLLHPDFLDIVKFARRKRFYITVTTNGSLLTEELVNSLAEVGAITLRITIQSHIPEKHDEFFKIPGLFNRILKISKYILETGILEIGWNTNILKTNFMDTNKLMELAENLGIPLFHNNNLFHRRDGDSSPTSFMLNEEDWRRFYASFKSDTQDSTGDLKDERRRHFSAEATEKIAARKGATCNVGLFSLSVLNNGNVVPCLNWHNRVLGNINEHSIKDIWLENPFLKELQSLKGEEFAKCLNCPFKANCYKCPAANERATGDFRAPKDDYCAFVEAVNSAAKEIKYLRHLDPALDDD